jgi:hypothetical protein
LAIILAGEISSSIPKAKTFDPIKKIFNSSTPNFLAANLNKRFL